MEKEEVVDTAVGNTNCITMKIKIADVSFLRLLRLRRAAIGIRIRYGVIYYIGLWLLIVVDVSVWNIRGRASEGNQVKSG